MRKIKAKQEDNDEMEMADIRTSMSKTLEKTYNKGDSNKCSKRTEELSQNEDTIPYC